MSEMSVRHLLFQSISQKSQVWGIKLFNHIYIRLRYFITRFPIFQLRNPRCPHRRRRTLVLGSMISTEHRCYTTRGADERYKQLQMRRQREKESEG